MSGYRRIACSVVWMLIPVVMFSQTRVDLERQSKGRESLSPPFEKPIRKGPVLPQGCSAGELFFLEGAPAGGNLHVCHDENQWAPQGSAGQGTVTIQSDGVSVGVRPTVNFVPGAGLSQVITDMGSQVNVQQSLTTEVLLSNSRSQSGEVLLCASSGGTGAAYSCSMMPALTALTAGMVFHWIPEIANTGGATTLDVDILGPVPVRLADGVAEPRPGDLLPGRLYPVWYDGDTFRLMQSPTLEDFQTIAAHQSGAALYCAPASGSGSSYQCALAAPLPQYTPGMMLAWRPDVDVAGGPVTLAVDSLEQVPVVLRASNSIEGVRDPVAGELTGGELYLLWFDGAQFRVAGQQGSLPVNGAEPECGVALRGKFWFVGGGAEEQDRLLVCAKDEGGLYDWRQLY